MRRGLGFAWLLAVAVLVVACGGGGGGSSNGSGGNGTSGSGNINPMSDAARGVIIYSALAATQKVTYTDGIADSNQLLTAAKTVKGLKNLQIGGDGCVIGQFSDGVPITFINNRPTGDNTPAIAKPKWLNAQPQTTTTSSSIQLLDSEDPIFISDRTWDDPAAFNAHGYPGTAVTLATVEAYRALGDHPMACLNMSGHGGTAIDAYSGQPVAFAVWTASQAGTTSTGATYATDLSDGSMGFALGRSAHATIGDNGERCHYMLLPKFMSKYKWEFTKNSWVTLGVCWGGSAYAAPFRTALFNLGASLVTGWTRSTKSDWDYANNSYMYDILLSANVVDPATPPRRPFAWPDVVAALQRVNNITFQFNGKPTVWTFFPAPGSDTSHGFQLFNPTIVAPTITPSKDGKTVSVIFSGNNYGVPGANSPTFTIGGVSYTPTLDKYGNYEVSMAPSACFGAMTANVAGPAGEKLVSNPRNVSVWTGTVTTTSNNFGNEPGEASIVGTMPVHFRADLQSTYLLPDAKTPTPISPVTYYGHSIYGISNDGTDTMSVTASGVSTTNNYDGQGKLLSTQTDTYSGNQSVQLFGGFNGVTLSVPPSGSGGAYMQVFEDTPSTMTDQYKLTVFSGSGSTSSTNQLNDAFTSEVFTNVSGDQWFSVGLGSNFSVTGDTQTVSSDGRTRYEIQYSTLACTSPPNNTTAR